MPTLVSRPLDDYATCAEALDATHWPAGGARCLGVHLEGPFLAPSRHGAHDPSALLVPTRANVEALIATLRPRAITLAPELPGAFDAIERLRSEGIAVFVGHTEADARTARAAIAAGATMLTHALNAMRGIETREATALSAFLMNDRAHLSVIADGVHVHPENLELIGRLVGSRLVAVSDASAPAAAEPGTYELGPRRIAYDGKRVTRGGGLAGSGRLLDTGVRTLVEAGFSLEDAWAAATEAPRTVIGAGVSADAVLWDDRLRVRLTVVDGEVAYRDTDLPFDPQTGFR
jgi:N-acetylglucosamine-6-phosphate deacetylase